METCSSHRTKTAEWRCLGCSLALCSKCVDHQTLGRQTLTLCSRCGEPCARARLPGQAEADESTLPQGDPATFYAELPRSLAYPFHGRGPLMFLGAALALVTVTLILTPFTVSDTGRFMQAPEQLVEIVGPLPTEDVLDQEIARVSGARLWFGLVALILVGGYLASYQLAVLRSSANGETQLPRWPTIGDIWEGILWPFVLVSATALLSLSPALIALFATSDPEQGLRVSLPVIVLLVPAVLYFPMALLHVALSDSLAGLNPVLVFRSVGAVPVAYGVLLGLLVLTGLGETAFRWGIRLASAQGGLLLAGVLTAAQAVISLYVVTVEARVLGLLYRCFGPRLALLERQD